ncbi:MAG: prohibitin family protein [Tepidisphaeraceae bacterium]
MRPSIPQQTGFSAKPFFIGAGVVAVVITLIVVGASFYIVEPGFRGVRVTLGKVDQQFLAEGFGFKWPAISDVKLVAVRQQTRESPAECYSQDLQQVNMRLKLRYSVPEASVVKIFQQYAGDPFDTLIIPSVQEALKEQTALLSAEQIVKSREQVKIAALKSARQKIGAVVSIEDLVLENITLSRQLEEAIEQKMVQEQNASKAKFEQDRRKIEADTRVIEAEAEAKSIRIRGEALRENPDLINLQIVEKWDGRSPMVVGGGATTQGSGATVLLPLPAPQK